jgi:hypothetical protein
VEVVEEMVVHHLHQIKAQVAQGVVVLAVQVLH